SHRGGAFLRRVEALPAVLEAALGALTGLPDRPVSLLHTETALAQLGGVTELVQDGLREARERAGRDEAADLVKPLEAAASAAVTALDGFRTALDTQVRERASGEAR